MERGIRWGSATGYSLMVASVFDGQTYEKCECRATLRRSPVQVAHGKPLPDSALCQLTRRMVFELAKQLRISTVVSGGFANSSHRVAGRVGKTYAWFSVRFANSLGGWCVSWQSIHFAT